LQAALSQIVPGKRPWPVVINIQSVNTTKRISWLLRLGTLIGFALGATHACAQSTIKVLWYRYASPTSHYVSFVNTLAANAHLFAKSSGVRWEVSFFGPDDAAPEFSRYNALVIESGEAFRTGSNRNLDIERATPNYSGILNNRAAIAAARGERTFLSATDGDFHALRGDSGSAPPGDTESRWDGARGHLINAVNWAGSGKGLGIVAWCDCEFPGSAWWQHPNSFLRAELAGRVKYFRDNAPLIPRAAAELYLNHGITSLGMSKWQVSFHGGFRLPLPGYTPVIMSTAEPDYAVAVASSASAAAPAGPNPNIQFVLERVAVNEKDRRVELSVARSANPIGAVSVNYATADGTARAGQDYVQSSGTVLFAHGELGTRTIALEIVNDGAVEAPEQFVVNLSAPSHGAVLGALTSATIEIADAGDAGVAQIRPRAPPTAATTKGGCSLNDTGQLDLTLLAAAAYAALRVRAKRC
jgi:hypothetical protein